MFEKNESYAHLYAKKVLAEWLRDCDGVMPTVEGDKLCWAKNGGVFVEYCYTNSAAPIYE